MLEVDNFSPYRIEPMWRTKQFLESFHILELRKYNEVISRA